MTTHSCLETRVDEILAQFVSSEGPGVAVLIGRGSNVLVRKAYGYGFGQISGERRGVREIRHGGATLGYNAQLSRFTDEQLTVVLLSNAAGIGLDRILGLIAEEMLGDKMVPLVPASLPHEHLMEKAGRYRGKPRDSAMALAVEFSQESEALNATLYQNERCLRLYELVPLSRDLFLADRATDTYLEFIRDYSGTAAGVRIKSVGRITQLDKV